MRRPLWTYNESELRAEIEETELVARRSDRRYYDNLKHLLRLREVENAVAAALDPDQFVVSMDQLGGGILAVRVEWAESFAWIDADDGNWRMGIYREGMDDEDAPIITLLAGDPAVWKPAQVAEAVWDLFYRMQVTTAPLGEAVREALAD